ncbi:6,7-dimethyl-8-ribityllumazine synthase [Paralimibaculum aggregatum]|uniref:6,7-dimethyl-8-ribityllumazine synthase n=1 Tax=Paralimibaculum aggregatum TaxID=3036245 RepID=A0ABQ6LEA4_9RHOB|nr:6,7-dimethyl-8-ribityllumazine synthase [Limibaculum sp. NKW23]GMG81676.1 6,7-dimethyl-8-ribityllumazine synthase [Limibaculum sp. NKW23]
MATREEAGGLALPAFDPAPRVLVVIAPYYDGIAAGQLAGARAVLQAAGAEVEEIRVPGALEIPPAIRLAADSGRFDAYVALGCVIRGETTHYETVCEESARGITLLGIGRGLCIGNGILTCETLAQAEERADPARQDKGGGAAAAALHLAALARRFGPGPGPLRGEDEIFVAATGLSRTA